MFVPILLLTTSVVHINGFAFKPATLHITAGNAVRFVNDDQEAHTVTGSGNAFDSGGLDTKDAWTHTFAKPGRYAYFCELHPYMRGVIIVSPAKGGKS